MLAAWGQALMLLSRYDESRATLRGGDRDRALDRRPRGGGPRAQHARLDLGLPRRPRRRRSSTWRRARAIAEEVGDLDDLARAYLNLAEILARPLNRLDEALEVAREGIELSQQVGLDGDYGVSLQTIAAGALFEGGRWDEAAALLRGRPGRSPIECAAIDFHLAGAKLTLGRGALDAAAGHLAAARG